MEKIRRQQLIARQRLVELDLKHQDLDALIDRAKHTSISQEQEVSTVKHTSISQEQEVSVAKHMSISQEQEVSVAKHTSISQEQEVSVAKYHNTFLNSCELAKYF